MTVSEIIMLVTALATLIFGELSKRFGWVKSKYIPYQNFFVGIISGLLVFFLRINEDLSMSLISCLFSSMCAGGTYDFVKVGDDK